MKIFLYILGVLFILVGSLWCLQGLNVLAGSVMSGQTQWVINGAIVAVLGIALVVWNARRK